jgi:hypothetical protein
MKKWSQNGNPLEEEEMLATHQSNQKLIHSSRKMKKKLSQDGNLPEEGYSSFPSINWKSIILQRKME